MKINKNFKQHNYRNKLIKKNINLKLENMIKFRELSKKIQNLNKSNIKANSIDMLLININNQKKIDALNLSTSSITTFKGEDKKIPLLTSNLSLPLEGREDSLISLPVLNDSDLNNSNKSLYLLNYLKDEERRKSYSPVSEKEEKNNRIRNYLNSFTHFNKNLAKEQNNLYQFNKANNKPYKFLFDKASNLLKLSFLSMGCLISKPVYKVIFTKNNLEFEHDTSLQNTLAPNTQKIIIDLFYFIRKNKNKYLNKIVEENENIIYISHPKYASLISKAKEGKGKENQILKNILCKYNDKFQFLSDYLSSIFKSEVELNLLRLPKVYYNSNILVQDLALKSYRFRFVKLVSRLFRKANISASSKEILDDNSLTKLTTFPSYLSGINIKLAGRTFRQRVVPRMTVKRSQKGSLSNINVQFIDRARFTGKTRRGSFSFTITLGHVFK